MTKGTFISTCLLMLAGLVVSLPEASFAKAAGDNESAGGSLSAIFATEALVEEAPVEEDKFSKLGPALLLVGIILLAASGRQYSKQHAFTNIEMNQVMQSLDNLVDDSVHIDSNQSETLHAELQSLEQERQQLIFEIQRMS